MGWFSEKDRDQEIADRDRRAGRKAARRDFYRMTKSERAKFIAAMAGRGAKRGTFGVGRLAVKPAINASGRIVDSKPFRAVGKYRTWMSKGLCATCGGAADNGRGHVCSSCVSHIGSLPSVHEVEQAMSVHTVRGLTTRDGRKVPPGQNMNGLVYDEDGRRVFPNEIG